MSLAALAIQVILAFPFVAAAVALAMAIQGLRSGTVRTGGRFLKRTVCRASEPGAYWLEIGLRLLVTAFLILVGLLFTGHAPGWFAELMSHSRRRR
jgi:hypothetical protein